MNWRDLVNVRTSSTPPVRKRGEPQPAGAKKDGERGGENKEATGVFITPQSLATFPVATAAVGIVWKVAETLVPSWKDALIVPAIISLLLGALLFFISITDPDAKRTSRDLVIGVVVAIINSCYLFASAVGIIGAAKS